MPPKAAPNGSIAFLKEASSPFVSSRLISVAASTKKKAIMKLLIHCKNDPGRCSWAKTLTSEFHKLLYQLPLEELVIKMDIRVQAINNTPVARLSPIKSLIGVMIREPKCLVLDYLPSPLYCGFI